MRYNSRAGVRQPMPFRKHQVDCLCLWRLSSPWILKRILLAIFNLRGREEGRRLSQGCLAKGFRVKAGARGWLGPPCGRVLSSPTEQKGDHFLVNINVRGRPRRAERVRHGRPRRRKAICRAHPHPSESQNEGPTRIDQQERAGAIHRFKKIRGIYLRKDDCARPFSSP